MPNYKTHIIFGIFIAGLVTYTIYKFELITLSFQQLLSIGPIIFGYSILPDIDIASSKISGIFRIVGLAGILVGVLSNLKILSITLCTILLILQFVKHRHFFHTILAGFLFSSVLIYYDYVLGIFAFMAYFSHLLLDRQVKLI